MYIYLYIQIIVNFIKLQYFVFRWSLLLRLRVIVSCVSGKQTLNWSQECKIFIKEDKAFRLQSRSAFKEKRESQTEIVICQISIWPRGLWRKITHYRRLRMGKNAKPSTSATFFMQESAKSPGRMQCLFTDSGIVVRHCQPTALFAARQQTLEEGFPTVPLMLPCRGVEQDCLCLFKSDLPPPSLIHWQIVRKGLKLFIFGFLICKMRKITIATIAVLCRLN